MSGGKKGGVEGLGGGGGACNRARGVRYGCL